MAKQFFPITQVPGALNDDASIVQMAYDICCQLGKRHKAQNLHFDIKPQTLMVDEKGRYHLSEPTGQLLPQFAAPEVVTGSAYYGYSCDTYALGLVMYWLLNNRRPAFCPQPPNPLMAEISQAALDRRIAGEQLPPPANGSEPLKALVLRACAADPIYRFQTAEEMKQALLNLGYPIQKGGSKKGLKIGIILGAVAAVGIALALILPGVVGTSKPTPTQPPEAPMSDGTVAELATVPVLPAQPLEFTIGVSEEDIPWVEQMLERYLATTGFDMTYEIIPMSSSDAHTYAEAGDLPDIYIYDSYSATWLHEMGALAPVSGWNTQVQGVTPSEKLDCISRGNDGHHYGIPMSGTTWFLYYNADIFPNTNSILEMINYGHLAFPITNGWFTGAFFADHGNAFYGVNGLDRSRYDLSSVGVSGMECLETLVGHPNVYLLDGEGGHWAILDGRADAYVGGIWDVDDAAEAFEAVGGTMAMCPMPDMSADYPIGLSPFANYQLMGLNADRTGDLMLMDVMYFLCSGESLELRYEITGEVPCYPELVTDSTIYGQADRVNAETLYTIACPQSGYMPEDYWSFMQNLGYDFMNDKVHPEDYEYYATMLEDILYG